MIKGSTETGAEAARATVLENTSLTETAFEMGRRLAEDPNIQAVGRGIKLRGGDASGNCVVFFVREKLRSPEQIAARGSWVIPPIVNGYPTDVVEVGALLAAAADRSLPAGKRGTRVAAPLIGGTATMALNSTVPGPGGYGTIGGLCFDAATNAPLLLSNAHVWGQSVGDEVTQPVSIASLFGASAVPATSGAPPAMVLTRVPAGLEAPVVFANALAQAYLVSGSEDDALTFGQSATSVTAATRTSSERVTSSGPAAGLPPAGRRLSPVLAWSYQRSSSAAVGQASSNSAHTPKKLLAARRLFTNSASYTGSQTINLYAEIIPAAGGAPTTASAHLPLVLLYPLGAGGKLAFRLLRPTSRQSVTAVTTQFTGFPAPARLGAVTLPFTVARSITVDSVGAGTFQAASAGTLPAGTLALKLPVGSVRLFIPASTEVVLDIDLRNFTGTLIAQGVNSAGDDTGTTTIPAAGGNGRTSVTIAGSELVEVRLTIAGAAVLYGVSCRRASPETTAPLSYAGSIAASDLTLKGKWGASLFVQAADSGFPESANVIETAIGAATLVADATFDVA